MPAKAAAKPKPAEKKAGGRGRRIEVATKATFGVDDKRAQYARLVIFNWGVREKSIAKSKDVNSASNSEIEKAGKALVAGNMLDGKDGIVLIQELSKAGATDENVAKRGLTTAYAQEVRPFLRRLMLSDSFGRRSGARKPKAEAATDGGEASEGK